MSDKSVAVIAVLLFSAFAILDSMSGKVVGACIDTGVAVTCGLCALSMR